MRRPQRRWLAAPGLQEIVLSVFETERVAHALTEVGGYLRQSLPDASAEQYSAWKLSPPESGAHGRKGGARRPAQRIEQSLLIPPTAARMGCLRLVRFQGLPPTIPQQVMRSSQRSWDTGGIFDVDVFARDVDAAYRGLQRHGWTAMGEPVEYREAEFHVRQVVAVGPDGLVVAIIQRYEPPATGLDAHMPLTAIFNSTQLVRDFAGAAQFYEQVLGFQKTHDFVIDAAAEPGADVLGLPLPQAINAQRRIGMFRPPWAEHGAIELIENSSMHGRDFSAACVAPNVGLLALRFCVPNVRQYAAEIQARGGQPYAALMRMNLAPYGAVELFSIRSPEGAIVEFLQRIGR